MLSLILREIETIDPEHPGPVLEKIELARSIVGRALDPDDIAEWNDAGRPLASIPDKITQRGDQIDQLYDTARYNVWMYDPQNDDWVTVNEAINLEDAREVVGQLEADPRIGIEYLILPISEVPRSDII